MAPTTQQKKAALAVAMAVCETIREAGLVPSGHLYAHLMTQNCTLEQFEALIRLLVNAGLVRREGQGTELDRLVWAGPAIASEVRA